jgi:DNA-binding CsgD family transcriptional regulator
MTAGLESGARLLGDLADLGCQHLGRRGYRSAALERLGRALGFDGAMFHTLAGDTTLEDCVTHGVDEQLLLRCHVEYGGRYEHDVAAMQRAAQGGVCRDLDLPVERARERVPLYREISRPMGYGNSVYVELSMGGAEVASLFLMRPPGSRHAFTPEHAQLLRMAVPVLTLAEVVATATAPRSASSASSPALADLTRRQRDICELLVLGFTNKEIARALGLSAHTVRNALAAIFRRTEVTTRAELVGVLYRGDPAR